MKYSKIAALISFISFIASMWLTAVGAEWLSSGESFLLMIVSLVLSFVCGIWGYGENEKEKQAKAIIRELNRLIKAVNAEGKKDE